MNKFDAAAFLQDLEQLVNIDSGSTNREGTAKVAEILAEKYAVLDWTVRTHQFDPAVGLCLEISNKPGGPYDVLLIGHMDTVFPAGTAAARPFTVKGQRAYGPGVNDMKSGLLLAYYVLGAMHKTGALSKAAICVALNCDEEIGSRYSRHWIEELARNSRYALILEPARPNGALVRQRKGVRRYTLEISGVAAHAGVDPEKGRSAIQEMAHWILALHALTDYSTGTTVNVGVVEAGTAPNVVAANAKAEVDLRVVDIAEADKVESTMRNLAAQPKTAGVTARFICGIERPPLNPSPQSLELCRAIEHIGAGLGVDVHWTPTGGGSDGNFTAALGVPTIDSLGPVGGGSHGNGEYMEIQSLQPRFNLLRGIISYLISSYKA